METTVTNLRTQTTKTYTLRPLDAVRAAWLQEHGNYNTWTYDSAYAPAEPGHHFWFCGDWAAKKL